MHMRGSKAVPWVVVMVSVRFSPPGAVLELSLVVSGFTVFAPQHLLMAVMKIEISSVERWSTNVSSCS